DIGERLKWVFGYEQAGAWAK
nr:hypothetical protein [Tanacetum cinerariifolium]